MLKILQDHNRFKNIIRGRIKKDFKKFIVNSEMMGRSENESIKIPMPSIDLPKFKYGPKDEGGEGKGKGEKGQGAKGEGSQAGEAGDQEGQHFIEVDLSFDELADILGQELELPKIEPKGHKNIQTQHTKYSGRSNVGPEGLRHFKSSYKEALKRSIASGEYDPDDPMVIPIKVDLRYKSFKQEVKPKTNAVVIYMMDVSGSMGDEQKEIVRLESFWINTWLKRNYKGLETRFIIHDAAAKEVDEKTFFSTSESGGTLISSAYKLCQKIIEEEYPIDEWNIYPFHFSDGDNWSGEDTRLCVKILEDFFLPKVNMFGYGQVESKYGSGQFSKDLDKYLGGKERLIISKIENKEKIPESIKDFLGKGN